MAPRKTRQSNKNTPKAKINTQNKTQNRCLSPQEGGSKQFFRQQNNQKSNGSRSAEAKEKQQNNLIQSNTENKNNMNEPSQQSIEARVLQMSAVEFHEYTNVVELIEKRFRKENYPEEKLQKLLSDIDVYVFRVYDKYQRKPKYRKDEFFKNLKIFDRKEQNKYIDHSKKRNRVELVMKDGKRRYIVKIPKLASSEKTAKPLNSQLSDDTDSCIGRIVQRSTKRQREQRIYDDSSEEPDCDDQNINLAEATPEVLAPASRKPTQSSDLTPKETRQSKNTPKAKTKTQNKIQNRCLSPQEGSSKQFIRQQNNPNTTSCRSNTEPKEKQQNDLIQSNTENKDNTNKPLQQSIEDRVLKMSVVEFHEYTNVVELIDKRFREENYPEEKLQKLLSDIDVYVFRVYDKYQRKPKYRKDEFFKNMKIFDRKEQNKYIDHSKKRNRVELVMKDGKRRYIVKIPRPASSEKTAKPFTSQLSDDTDTFSGQICHGSTKRQQAQRIYDDNSEGPDCDDQNLNLAETTPDDLVTASQNLTQSSDEKSCNQEEKRGRRGTTSSKNKILKQKAMKRCPSPKEGCSKWLYNSPSRTSCQKSIQEYFQPSPTIVNNVVKEKPGPLSKKRNNCETSPKKTIEPHECVEHAIDNNVVKEKPGPLSKKRNNCETNPERTLKTHEPVEHAIDNNVVKEKPGPLSKKRNNCETNPERTLKTPECVEHVIVKNVLKEKPGPLSKKGKSCETSPKKTIEPNECVEHAIDNNVVKEKPGPLSKKRNNCETNLERTLNTPECVEHAIVKNVLKEKPGPLSKKGKSCETSPKKTIEPHESVEHAIDNNVVKEKPGPLSKKRNNCETNSERVLEASECVERAIVNNVVKEKPGPLSKKRKKCETNPERILEAPECAEHAIVKNVLKEKPGPLEKKGKSCETTPEKTIEPHEFVEHAIDNNVKEKPGSVSKKRKNWETNPERSVEHVIANNIVKEKPGPLSKKRKYIASEIEAHLDKNVASNSSSDISNAPMIASSLTKVQKKRVQSSDSDDDFITVREKKNKAKTTPPSKKAKIISESNEIIRRRHINENTIPKKILESLAHLKRNENKLGSQVDAAKSLDKNGKALDIESTVKSSLLSSSCERNLVENATRKGGEDNRISKPANWRKGQASPINSIIEQQRNFMTIVHSLNECKEVARPSKRRLYSNQNNTLTDSFTAVNDREKPQGINNTETINNNNLVSYFSSKYGNRTQRLSRDTFEVRKTATDSDLNTSELENERLSLTRDNVKILIQHREIAANQAADDTNLGNELNPASASEKNKHQSCNMKSLPSDNQKSSAIYTPVPAEIDAEIDRLHRLSCSTTSSEESDSVETVIERLKPCIVHIKDSNVHIENETLRDDTRAKVHPSPPKNKTIKIRAITNEELNKAEGKCSSYRGDITCLSDDNPTILCASHIPPTISSQQVVEQNQEKSKTSQDSINIEDEKSGEQSKLIETRTKLEINENLDDTTHFDDSDVIYIESGSENVVIIDDSERDLIDSNVHIENETLRDDTRAKVHPSPPKNKTIKIRAITNEELKKAEGEYLSFRDDVTCLGDDNPTILCPSHIPPTMSSQQAVEQNQEKSKTSQDSINIGDEKGGEQSKLIEARPKLEMNENLDDTNRFEDSDVIYIESGSENVVIIEDSERDLIDSNVHIENQTLRDDKRAKVHPSPSKNKIIKIRAITNEELNKAEGEYLSFRDDITCLGDDNPTILCVSHIPPTISSQQAVEQNQEKSKTSQDSINIEDEKSGEQSKLIEARPKLEINENLDDTTRFDDSDVIYIESGSKNLLSIEDSERDRIDSNVDIENETLRDDTRAKVHPSPLKNKTIEITAITNEELNKSEREYLSFRDDITCLGDDNPTILCASHIPATMSSQQVVEQNQEKSKTSQQLSINIEEKMSGEQSKLIEARPKLEINENLDDTTHFDDSDVIYIENGSETVLSIEDSEQDLIDEMQQFGNISYQSPSFSPVKPVDESHQHCIPFIESICLSNVETNCYPSGSSENSILPIKQETTADDPEAVGNKDADVLGIENCTFASEKDLERTKISESGRSENSNKSNNNEQNAAEKKEVEIKQELIEYSQYDDEIQFLPSKTVVVILDHGNNTEDLFHQMCNPNEVDFIEEPVAQSSEHRKDIPAENAQNENDSSSPAEHFPSPPIMSSASSNQSSLMNPAQIISSTMITSSAESIKLEEYQGQSGSSLSDTNIDSTVNAHRDSESSEQVRCEETNSHKDVPTLVRNATSTHIGNGTVQMLENPSNSIDTGVAPEIDVGVAPEIDVGVAPELALKNDIVSERNIQTQNARGRVRAVMKIIVEGRYRPLQLVKEKCEFGHSSSGSGDRPKNNAKAIESISSYEKEDERDYLIEDASQDIISPHSSFNPDAYLEGDTSMFGNLSIHSQPKSNGTKETTDTKLSSEHGKNSALPTIQKPHHEKLSAKSSPSTTLCRPVHSSQYTTLTYLDINTIEFWKNVNDLHYECGAPFLQHSNDIRAKATIKFRMGHCCIIEIMGNSLRLLLGLTIKEWTCVLKLISMIEKFKYNSSGERPKDQSLPDQILYHLFKTLPKFAQVTLECDPTMNENQANCVSVSLGTEYLKHYKSLTRALDPKHLERLKRLKATFHDFWE